MKARTKDHPHHFGKLKNDVARPSAWKNSTVNRSSAIRFQFKK